MERENLLYLKNAVLIGIGTNRACYIHPDDDSKCIKVTISNDFSESNREKKYYNFLKKRNISWRMLAKYYGTVETDLGEGLVFELVKNESGEVSKPLIDYFVSEKLMEELLEPLPKLKALKEYLLTEKIIVKDLSLANILYQKRANGEDRLMIVDGVINNDFIPIATYVDYFTRRKINRRWIRFISHFEARIGDNKLLQKMYEKNPL